MHVGGVLLLFGQGLLDHGSRGAFIVSETADDLAVGLNGDPFVDRVFVRRVGRPSDYWNGHAWRTFRD